MRIQVGDEVIGATLNKTGSFRFRATKVGKVVVPTTTTFANYRRVAGVALPHRAETRDDINGLVVYEITYVETNLELAEEPWVMTPPEGG